MTKFRAKGDLQPALTLPVTESRVSYGEVTGKKFLPATKKTPSQIDNINDFINKYIKVTGNSYLGVQTDVYTVYPNEWTHPEPIPVTDCLTVLSSALHEENLVTGQPVTGKSLTHCSSNLLHNALEIAKSNVVIYTIFTGSHRKVFATCRQIQEIIFSTGSITDCEPLLEQLLLDWTEADLWRQQPNGEKITTGSASDILKTQKLSSGAAPVARTARLPNFAKPNPGQPSPAPRSARRKL